MSLPGLSIPESLQQLPKVELHRHLEGSLRLRTVVEIARHHGIDPTGTGELQSLVQIMDDQPYTFQTFLAKFTKLRLFYKSPDVISRVTREAIADAAADHLRYLELRFTPVALSRSEDFPLDEVFGWVVQSAADAAAEFGMTVRLIASFNRHEPVALAETVTRLALDHRQHGVVGLDIAGNEADFSALPFRQLLRDAQRDGLGITVHAGEWNGPANIAEAIEMLGAQRIGHGVRVLEDPGVAALARESGVAFEVCLTSNVHSGVFPSLQRHPFRRMLEAGLNVTINTDDPSISRITLSNEYAQAMAVQGLSLAQVQECILNAAKASFLPPVEKSTLVSSLTESFASHI